MASFLSCLQEKQGSTSVSVADNQVVEDSKQLAVEKHRGLSRGN